MTTPGRRVHVVARKWPDRPHWEHEAVRLGTDEHGTWVGAAPGSTLSRPGASYVTDQAQVSLLPPDGAFAATFYAPGGTAHCDVWVDVGTVPVWDGDTVSTVDLDLDVVRGWSGRVWVEDEDEFAAHRTRFGYPDDVVRLALDSCARVHADLLAGRAPYDGTARGWLARLAATLSGPRP